MQSGFKSLKEEFTAKINQANDQIQLGNAKYQEVYGDATKLARELQAATKNNQGQV